MDGTQDTGVGIGAPPPHEVYANAPDLRREMHQVLALGAERDGRQARPVSDPLVDARAAERAWLLRRAALMDRMALDAPAPGPLAAAAETAEQLVLHDRRHPDLVAGPHHPDAVTPALGHRVYVRQEYAAWTTATRAGIRTPDPTRRRTQTHDQQGEGQHDLHGDRHPARPRGSRPTPLAAPRMPDSHV
ncbi:hypothetical protein [Streptomyces sp. NPDC006012]|uniref:hypothetical protein n=1 Tax=Streptomyces sp. NPDC006012 TaxID=3364739 RepID=UPI003679D058